MIDKLLDMISRWKRRRAIRDIKDANRIERLRMKYEMDELLKHENIR